MTTDELDLWWQDKANHTDEAVLLKTIEKYKALPEHYVEFAAEFSSQGCWQFDVGHYPDSTNCPLCRKYAKRNNGNPCYGCPLQYESAYIDSCGVGSLYFAVRNARTKPDVITACANMVAFLEGKLSVLKGKKE